MDDEPTRRFGSTEPHSAKHLDGAQREGSQVPQPFGVLPQRPSTRPGEFSDREGPTLASPSSSAMEVEMTVELRLTKAMDRIHQLEADLEALYGRVTQLSEAVSTEAARGRAARMGRYLLWGTVIAAMATFWMMLRLRAGIH